jgi:hypothetical protein
MYSPKIDPALIPRLYRLAKAREMPMTHLVNQLLAHGIAGLEQAAEHISDPPATPFHRQIRTQNRVRTPRERRARKDK